MHGLAVRKQHDPKEPALGLRNGAPSSNPAVGLNDFPNRRFDRTLNPFVPNHGPIGRRRIASKYAVVFTAQRYQNPAEPPSCQQSDSPAVAPMMALESPRRVGESTFRCVMPIINRCAERQPQRLDGFLERLGVTIEDQRVDPGQPVERRPSFGSCPCPPSVKGLQDELSKIIEIVLVEDPNPLDRKSTRLNSSHRL